jgi:hypothetical protein
MPQLDALYFVGNEKAHKRDVHQRHLVQVQHAPRAVPADLGLEFVQTQRSSGVRKEGLTRPALSITQGA